MIRRGMLGNVLLLGGLLVGGFATAGHADTMTTTPDVPAVGGTYTYDLTTHAFQFTIDGANGYIESISEFGTNDSNVSGTLSVSLSHLSVNADNSLSSTGTSLLDLELGRPYGSAAVPFFHSTTFLYGSWAGAEMELAFQQDAIPTISDAPAAGTVVVVKLHGLVKGDVSTVDTAVAVPLPSAAWLGLPAICAGIALGILRERRHALSSR